MDFQSEGQEISLDELVKLLVKASNRQQRKAAVRPIIDIYAIVDVVLVAEDEVNKVGRRLVGNIGCFSAVSVIAERGFSQLARIRTKLRNRLKTRNLNASMSLRLNPLPSLESVFTKWRSEKDSRRKVVYPLKERKQYTMESDLDFIVDQFNSDYSECLLFATRKCCILARYARCWLSYLPRNFVERWWFTNASKSHVYAISK